MSVMSALTEGMVVTVVGLTIVFAVLLILMFILMFMKSMFYKDQNEAKVENTSTVQPVTIPTVQTDEVNDEELVAILTAAIAASLNTSTYNLKIKSYRRIGNNTPAWNKAGLSDIIQSRI